MLGRMPPPGQKRKPETTDEERERQIRAEKMRVISRWMQDCAEREQSDAHQTRREESEAVLRAADAAQGSTPDDFSQDVTMTAKEQPGDSKAADAVPDTAKEEKTQSTQRSMLCPKARSSRSPSTDAKARSSVSKSSPLTANCACVWKDSRMV